MLGGSGQNFRSKKQEMAPYFHICTLKRIVIQHHMQQLAVQRGHFGYHAVTVGSRFLADTTTMSINFKRRIDVPQRFRHAAKPTWSKIPSVDHAARWQHPIVSSWSLRGQDFLVDGLMYLFLQSGVRCEYATKKSAWRCPTAMRKCRQLAHSTTGSAARGTSRKRDKERFLSTKGGSQNRP